MKRLRLFTAFFIVLSTVSCGNKMSPQEYNELITSLHETNWQYIDQSETMLLEAQRYQSGEDSAICANIYDYLDEVSNRLDTLRYPTEAEKFHLSAIKLITFLRDSVVCLYRQTSMYRAETAEWYDSWAKVDSAFKLKASALEDSLIVAQKKFTEEISINY